MNGLDAAPSQVAEPGDATALADRVLEVVPRTMRRIRARMRSMGPIELTVPQLRVLLFVRRTPGVGLSAVAEHVGVTKASASTLVDRLVRAGFIDRSDDPGERRRIQLRLTAAGSERVGLAHLAVRTWLAEELAALDAATLARLGPALDVLEGLGDASEPPR